MKIIICYFFVGQDISKKIITMTTSNKMGTIKVLALPLPQQTVEILEKNSEFFKVSRFLVVYYNLLCLFYT